MESNDVHGRVFQINLSGGGVPKLAVHQAEVTAEGIKGDQVRHTHVHGGPDRALCLYSLEHILALQGEGHTPFSGAMGENLTLVGLPWAELSPGARLRIGEAVLIEITNYTTPCDALEPYFKDRRFSRVSQKAHPGWSRLYARVLEPGIIRAGDKVSYPAV